MASVNKVILVGNLGRDPEMRYTPNGRPVTAFSVAVDEGSSVIVERFIAGNEHRLLVVGGKTVAAARGDFANALAICAAAAPEYIACPPRDPCEASPIGAFATKPRASIANMLTPARTKALVVARSCAWLLVPCRRMPLAKYTRAFFSFNCPSMFAAVCKAAS